MGRYNPIFFFTFLQKSRPTILFMVWAKKLSTSRTCSCPCKYAPHCIKYLLLQYSDSISRKRIIQNCNWNIDYFKTWGITVALQPQFLDGVKLFRVFEKENIEPCEKFFFFAMQSLCLLELRCVVRDDKAQKILQDVL